MNDLENYRNQINEIDSSLLELLDQRMKICQKVGEYKKKNNLQVLDVNREKILIEKLINLKDENKIKLDDNFIINLWTIIMNFSKGLQI